MKTGKSRKQTKVRQSNSLNRICLGNTTEAAEKLAVFHSKVHAGSFQFSDQLIVKVLKLNQSSSLSSVSDNLDACGKFHSQIVD
jgi:hypothetical protein